jgi:hypothetical protein
MRKTALVEPLAFVVLSDDPPPPHPAAVASMTEASAAPITVRVLIS